MGKGLGGVVRGEVWSWNQVSQTLKTKSHSCHWYAFNQNASLLIQTILLSFLQGFLTARMKKCRLFFFKNQTCPSLYLGHRIKVISSVKLLTIGLRCFFFIYFFLYYSDQWTRHRLFTSFCRRGFFFTSFITKFITQYFWKISELSCYVSSLSASGLDIFHLKKPRPQVCKVINKWPFFSRRKFV